MKKISSWKHKTAVKTLIAVYNQTSEKTREAGRKWYPLAGEIAREIANTQETGAGIIAALSPLTNWTENIWIAKELTANPKTSPRRTLGGSDSKARAIALGALPLAVLSGNKVIAFFHAINGDTQSVVIDRWAQRATGFVPKREGANTNKQYTNYVAAYKEAAMACGEDPSAFQAIIWIYVRKSSE